MEQPRVTLVEFPRLPAANVIDSAVAVIDGSVGALVAAADAVAIRTDADLPVVTNHLKALKDRRDTIDECRKSFSGPFDRAAKAINAVFRPILDRLESSERTLKNKYAIYVNAHEQEREAALERQRKAEEKVASTGIKVIPREAPAPVQRTTHADGASTSIKKRWTFEIVSEGDVPRQYLVVDAGVVDAKIAQLARVLSGKVPEDAIPGLRIFQTTEVAVRRSVR